MAAVERCRGCREFGCPFKHIPAAHKPRRHGLLARWFGRGRRD